MARPAAKPAPIALVRTGHMTPRTTTHPGPQKEDYKAGSGGHKRLALPLIYIITDAQRQTDKKLPEPGSAASGGWGHAEKAE